MKPTLQSDPLARLLDEWQPAPRLSPQFDQQLRCRVAAAATPPLRFWERLGLGMQRRPAPWLGALATLALLVGGSFALRTPAPAPAPSAALAAAVRVDPLLRDLQALDRNQALLDNLDALNAPPVQTPR